MIQRKYTKFHTTHDDIVSQLPQNT